LAALLWLPWFALMIRLAVDVMLGTPWEYSKFLQPALIGIWPQVGLGLWPLERLFRWQIVSVYPVAAFFGAAISALGWRIYWREQDFRLTRAPWLVGFSIAVPPLAPFIMWSDARKRYLRIEHVLEADVVDARQRLGTTTDSNN
jgi:hypothetical protein